MTRKMAMTAVSGLALGLALVLSVGGATSASARDDDHRNLAGRQHAAASGERSGPIWRDDSAEQPRRDSVNRDNGNRGNWGGGDRGQRSGQSSGQGAGQAPDVSGGGTQTRDFNRGGWNGGSRDTTPASGGQTRDRGNGGGWNRGGTAGWAGGTHDNDRHDNDRHDDGRHDDGRHDNDNRGGWDHNRDNSGRYDNDRHDDDRRGNDHHDDRHDHDNRGGWTGDRARGGWDNDRGHGGWDRGGGRRFDYRNDHRWNSYSGVRFGFYFFPGRGYYHVPDQYYGHRWMRGEYLPRMFYDYRIYDYDAYGLPVPPYGCAWFFVGEDAVLIDLGSGEVLDVWYDVW